MQRNRLQICQAPASILARRDGEGEGGEAEWVEFVVAWGYCEGVEELSDAMRWYSTVQEFGGSDDDRQADGISSEDDDEDEDVMMETSSRT